MFRAENLALLKIYKQKASPSPFNQIEDGWRPGVGMGVRYRGLGVLPGLSRIVAGAKTASFSAGLSARKENKMTRNLIDFDELLERTENDRELMRDLLTIFKEEFPERLQALSGAVESLNAAKVVLEAHALKGMLSNLAAIEAAVAVAELERLARNNETRKLLESFSHFKAIAVELSRQVEACFAEVSG